MQTGCRSIAKVRLEMSHTALSGDDMLRNGGIEGEECVGIMLRMVVYKCSEIVLLKGRSLA